MMLTRIRKTWHRIHPSLPDIRSPASLVLLHDYLEAKDSCRKYHHQRLTDKIVFVDYRKFDKREPEIHTIIGIPHSGSLASYILLKNDLTLRDPERKKFVLRKNRIGFNRRFLIWHREHFGLRCYYCGKETIIDCRNQSKIATTDHFVPISRDPSLKYDISNLIVACRSCNTKKAGNIVSASKILFYPPDRPRSGVIYPDD